MSQIEGLLSEILDQLKQLNENQKPKTKKRAPVKRFVKPTKEELEQYFYDQGSITCQDDATRFIDYYEANGWKVGKNAMKDWQATVRTWVQRGRENGQSGSKAVLTNLDDTNF